MTTSTPAIQAQTIRLIKANTLERLLDAFDATNQVTSHGLLIQLLPIIRGWLMDELEIRNPEAFNAWIDSGDASPREHFIPTTWIPAVLDPLVVEALTTQLLDEGFQASIEVMGEEPEQEFYLQAQDSDQFFLAKVYLGKYTTFQFVDAGTTPDGYPFARILIQENQS